MAGNNLDDTVNNEFCDPQGREGYERTDQPENQSQGHDHRARLPNDPEDRGYVAKRRETLAPTAPKVPRFGHFDDSLQKVSRLK